jgi:hypothetical protein
MQLMAFNEIPSEAYPAATALGQWFYFNVCQFNVKMRKNVNFLL